MGRDVAEIVTAIEKNGSLPKAIDALNRKTGRGLVTVPVRELTADEELFAESDIADPERPAGVRYRTSNYLKKHFKVPHLVKRSR